MTTDFTPWTLFVDIGIISALLLLGKLMRVKIPAIQKLFIPPSLLAGFMGLALGPGGFNVIPLSNQTGTYAGILIAFIFGCLAFTSQSAKDNGGKVARMWAYSQTGMLLQWGFGGLLGIMALKAIWPDITDAFGISMPAGYCGGHGTAAAIGQAFGSAGIDEMMTLAMTAATVGIVASVIIGLLIVKWATRKKHTAFLADFDDLPNELRTGLLPAEQRKSIGTTTCSSISIDSLTFNLIIVCLVALGGYMLSQGVTHFAPRLELPVFSCAFVVGIILKKIFDHTSVSHYVCPDTIGHISGALTDFLVAFGISAIKMSVVISFLAPISVLLISGLIVTALYVFIVSKKMMQEYWFEKAIFTWGWYTGTMAMGIALLRVVDPQMKSQCLDSYALAYLFIAPVEITLVTFAPVAFLMGYGIQFSCACLAASAAIAIFAYCKGWYRKPTRP